MAKTNGSMRDQLIDIKKTTLSKKDIHGWIADGEDHLNIWRNNQTELGKFLCFDNATPFEHPVLGTFKSISSFWRYITAQDRDDDIRYKHGAVLRQHVSKMATRHVDNLWAIIMDAVWHRLQSNPDMLKRFKENRLPIVCYYVDRNTGVRYQPKAHAIITRGYIDIQLALRHGRAPDFTRIMDHPDKDIYADITPEYIKRKRAEDAAKATPTPSFKGAKFEAKDLKNLPAEEIKDFQPFTPQEAEVQAQVPPVAEQASQEQQAA